METQKEKHILDQLIVLLLNSRWKPIGVKTVANALIQMMSGKENNPPVLALDISYFQESNGEYKFDQPISILPYKWKDWIELPIRPYDKVVHSARITIRVPTVLVSQNYSLIPLKKMALSGRNLYERDGGMCAYSGKKLKKEDASIDHFLPLSRGGTNTWDNVVLADKKINNKKGNKTNEEAKLISRVKPFEPKSKPISEFITDCREKDWTIFLKNNKRINTTQFDA